MLWHGAGARADALANLEDKLAEKIVSVTGRGTLMLEVTNRSSLSLPEAERVQRGLLAALETFGVQSANQDAGTTVRVSLSEDLRDYVWIAEIHQPPNETSVVIVSGLRLSFNVPPLEGATLAIRKKLLWSSEDRILDVAELAAGRFVVLYPEQVTFYKAQGEKWLAEQSFALSHLRPWPRDLRGRLALKNYQIFEAYLPGILCQGATTSTSILSCRQSQAPWPLGTEQFPLNGFFTPARNFFTGALSPVFAGQTSVAAYYSAAAVPRNGSPRWLFASVDGNVRWLNGAKEQITDMDWGSDIAAVHSGCGSGWQAIVSSRSPTDDSLRAFEVGEHAGVPASQPISLSGGVTALWAAADGASVTAVSRNRETGTYEAYRLDITCGQ